MDLDADGIEDPVASARDGEVNCALLRADDAAIGIEPGEERAIWCRLFVQDDGRGARIDDQLPRTAINQGGDCWTPIRGTERDADAGAGGRTIERHLTVAVVEQIVMSDEPALAEDAVDTLLKDIADDGFHSAVGDRTGADLIEDSDRDSTSLGEGYLLDGIRGLKLQAARDFGANDAGGVAGIDEHTVRSVAVEEDVVEDHGVPGEGTF